MMNLYFLDTKCRQHLVKENVDPGENGEGIMMDVVNDAAVRRPEFSCKRTRTWWDEFLRLWIDFGSHEEYYICQDEKKALNVAIDTSGIGDCEVQNV